jgi:cytochrome P450
MPPLIAPAHPDIFAASLQAASPHGGPDLLAPAGAQVLWTTHEPFMAERSLRLPIGSQRQRVWHVSDMDTGLRALKDRSRPPRDDPDAPPLLSTAFQPRPLRWLALHAGLAGPLLFGQHPNYLAFWMQDDPQLAAMRKLLMGPFKPTAVSHLRALITRTCREVLVEHRLRNSDVLDVAEYANDVLFRLMAYLLGARPETAPEMAAMFRRWMHRFNRSRSLASLKWQPDIYWHIARMIKTHDGRPGILADVQAAWKSGDHLGGDHPAPLAQYVALVWALIAAGTDTPGTVVAQTVWFLVFLGMLDEIRHAPAAMSAIDEGVRIYPPFTRPLMIVDVDEYELAPGVTARRGEYIETHLPAMNRYGFVDSGLFVPGRADAGRAVPFGAGAHPCIGQHYGKGIGAEIVLTLASEFVLRPLAGRKYGRQDGLLHRLEELPLSLTRRSALD